MPDSHVRATTHLIIRMHAQNRCTDLDLCLSPAKYAEGIPPSPSQYASSPIFQVPSRPSMSPPPTQMDLVGGKSASLLEEACKSASPKLLKLRVGVEAEAMRFYSGVLGLSEVRRGDDGIEMTYTDGSLSLLLQCNEQVRRTLCMYVLAMPSSQPISQRSNRSPLCLLSAFVSSCLN